MCNEEDKNILKALSELKLGKLNGVTLSFIPKDWEELKEFMENSIQNLNEFHFNNDDDMDSNLESSDYLSSLEEVASKTEKRISVDWINFSQKDFEKFIYFSKHIWEVSLWYDQLQLEEECNFGENMKGCKIKYLDLSGSGNEMNGNWKIKPQWFENLIKGIANCNPFNESLKIICIKDWEFSKDEAQSILNKYSLDDVDILT